MKDSSETNTQVTSVTIPGDVKRAIKKLAEQESRTFSAMVTVILREELARRAK